LGPLVGLQDVWWTLSVVGNPELESLHGLENVHVGTEIIDATILIENNPELHDIEALSHHANRFDDTLVLARIGVDDLSPLAEFEQFRSLTLRELDIESLGLASLREVGDLTVVGNPRLRDLSPVDDTLELADWLVFADNPELERIEGFAALEDLGALHIQRHDELEVVAGFDAIHSLSNFVLDEAPSLATFEALGSMREVASLEITGVALDELRFLALERADWLHIHDAAIATLELDALEDLGSVRLANVDALATLAAPQLVEAPDHVGVYQTPVLEEIELAGAGTFSEGIEVFEAPSLRRITMLQASAIPRIEFANVPALEELELAEVSSIDTLEITNAPMLGDLGLGDLEQLPLLVQLVGTNVANVPLDSPAPFGEHVWIRVLHDPAIVELSLPQAQTIGFVDLQDLPALVSISIPEVAGTLSTLNLVELPVLTTIDVPYQTIEGTLRIRDCAALTSLASFSELASVGDKLVVQGNTNLESLLDLASLSSVGGDVVIRDNPGFTDADAEAFVAGLAVGGTVDIGGNG
jgi:hypothetical protein